MSLIKRSIALDGHATSVALEPEFWAVIDEHARNNGLSLARVIASIDNDRGTTPLASALRVWALHQARQHATQGKGLREG